MTHRTIRDILQTRTLVKVRPETRVGEVARRMRDSYVGAALVMEGEHLIGIFTERDVLDRVVAEGRDPDTTEIQQVMTAGPIRVGLDMTTVDAARTMKERRLRHLPVEDDGNIVGVVSVRDFLNDEVSVYLM
ncbi:MAG: CBS domain-containing protein [Rhodospirillaceae bacterium]|nr:CBS domain-containing protein [Rhodospirillaceae bacterium]